jgi:hypothetical protein
MVDMQMGADDDVDFIGPPDVPKIVEEPGIEHVKGRPARALAFPTAVSTTSWRSGVSSRNE